MEMLFGGSKVEKKEAVTKNRTKPKKKSTVAKAPAEPAPLVKLDTAKPILVVGDFLGAGLANGLNSVFSQNPGVKVVERTQGSSGFARVDVYDWPSEVKVLMRAERPAAVIVLIGANDRQQIRVDKDRLEPMSADWVKEYTARATAMAAAVREQKVPLIWVGLPSFKSSKMSQDAITMNDIFRQAIATAGGIYVDVWDGFVDERGGFAASGPDINGQPARLRAADGVNLAKAGERKIAYYVERHLQKLIAGETLPALDPLGPGAPPIVAFPGGIALIDRTVPVSLVDPELDGGGELLGMSATSKPTEPESLGDKLAIEGVAPAAQRGRADDFGGMTYVVPSDALARGPETTTAITP
ncbi:MAG: DUF459 domain-containing protein [Rhizobiaceae bacterium]|nr:DUF459 domain-containing protein [Rhizobiaceae bacterium]